MSHEATNWAINQRGLKPAVKIVLWHLCDCHNPSFGGAFPSQEYLSDRCEIPRSTLNVYLDQLEAQGLIVREQRRKPGSKQMERTRYFFPFDPDFQALKAQKPSPESGHGNGDEAESGNAPEPSPENGESRVQNLDSNPVREPVIEPVREREGASASDEQEDDPKHLRKRVKALEVGRNNNPWPGALTSSTEWAERQFEKLTPDERRRAEERRDAYLAACPKDKHGHPKAVALGVYLRDRKFDDIDAIVSKAAKASGRTRIPPFGPAFAAIRMLRLLDGPIALTPPEKDPREATQASFDALSRISQARATGYLARKGVTLSDDGRLMFPADFLAREEARRVMEEGYPEVNSLHDAASHGRSTETDEDVAHLAALCEAVPVGSDMWARWADEHQRRAWPWLPDPGGMRIVYFPKGGPDGLAEFEAAARQATRKEAAE